jgi:hypothetical protein
MPVYGFNAVQAENYTVPPRHDDGSWSWVNRKADAKQATINHDGSYLQMYSPADSADSYSFYMRDLLYPSGPWKLTTRLDYTEFYGANYQVAGLVLYGASGTNFKTFGRVFEGAHRLAVVQGADSGGVPISTLYLSFSYSMSEVPWWRIRDDQTNLYFELSKDGTNWFTFFQQSRTATFTAAKVGLALNSRNGESRPSRLTVLSWKEENNASSAA